MGRTHFWEPGAALSSFSTVESEAREALVSTVVVPRLWKKFQLHAESLNLRLVGGKEPRVVAFHMKDNRHYKRYVYANPKREQEIRNIYKISSTIMGLWLLEQVDKGGLEESKRRAISNSLGRLLLPMVDSLGSKLAELEQA